MNQNQNQSQSQSQSQSQGQSQGQTQSQDQSQAELSTADTRPVRWLRVRHDTVYDYDAPVEVAHHLACLSPRSTPDQQVRNWSLNVDPQPDILGTLQERLSLDPWGNGRIVFSHARVHERLSVSSVFEAGIAVAPAPDLEASPPWEDVAESLRYHAGAVRTDAVEFALASSFVSLDPTLAAFGRRAFTPGLGVAAGVMALMSLIHAEFRYETTATDVGTRASEALALKRGVCQDFAHVMIGACRSLGLAARYVSGYLLTQPPPGKPRLVGADASHAWASVWCPGYGWLALDPTNNTQAGQDHVTLAWGCDYADVAPLRGVIRGGGSAEPSVAVTVEPLNEGA